MILLEATGEPADVVFGVDGREGLQQRLRTLLSTPVGSVPLDRDFGIDLSLLDEPLPRAMALLRVEVYTKIKKYISEVVVTKIYFLNPGFADTADGRLIPVIQYAEREVA